MNVFIKKEIKTIYYFKQSPQLDFRLLGEAKKTRNNYGYFIIIILIIHLFIILIIISDIIPCKMNFQPNEKKKMIIVFGRIKKKATSIWDKTLIIFIYHYKLFILYISSCSQFHHKF